MDQRMSYTIKEAAALTGVGRTTLYKLVNRGELPLVKIGLRSLVRCSDLEALLDRHLDRRAA